ncbi:MAG: dUTP diphosphatase [Deltaproteobacteria bacterium]|nr:dUTP diphosphatase [Deltaproteobacteria bacterium]
MEEIKVSVKRLPGNADISFPGYMTEGSSGMDVFAAVKGEKVIMPGERMLIPSGIMMGLPKGYEAEIRPRSGLAVKYGVTILNSPGTIDSDYRGEVKIVLINHGSEPFMVHRGDRIAQMIVNRVCRVSWNLEEDLEKTDRACGGFGHTG